MNFDVFGEFAYEFSSVLRRLEESMSDADFRCTGGFRTEDQRYALSQRELMHDILLFMDKIEDKVDEQIRQFETTIEEQGFQIDDYDNRMTEILEHIKDVRRMRTIEGIIKQDREDY